MDAPLSERAGRDALQFASREHAHGALSDRLTPPRHAMWLRVDPTCAAASCLQGSLLNSEAARGRKTVRKESMALPCLPSVRSNRRRWTTR